MPLVGGQGELQPTRNLGVQFTLFQHGGGADYTHHLTACPPGFENLAASLLNWTIILKTNVLISFSFSDSQEAKRVRGNENTFLDNPDSRKYYVNMLLENSFSEELNLTLSAPFSYVKHLNFVNFEEFNQTNPIYINMVSYE